MQLRVPVLAVLIIMLALAYRNPSPAAEKPVPPDKVKELMKERLATVARIHELMLQKFKRGNISFNQMMYAEDALLNAKLDLTETKEERIKVHEDMVKLAEQSQEHLENLFKAGQATEIAVLKARARLLGVRIDLEKARAVK